MQITPETIAWALEQIATMEHLRGAPQEENQKVLTARAFLRIVDDYKPNKYEIDPRDQPPPVYHQPKHYTVQQTVDWLLDELMVNNDGTFPSMRLIAETYDRGKTVKWGDKEEVKRSESVKS